jgi:purine nucleoside phosphorylase
VSGGATRGRGEPGGRAAPSRATALGRVAGFAPHAAVVFGSGLAALPRGAAVIEEFTYDELGWPLTAVPGHANRLLLAEVPAGSGARLRLALACGRPHLYEGWDDEDLTRCVRDLCAAGVPRVVLTNSTGSLRTEVEPGTMVACSEVVDLQRAPQGDDPEVLPVCRPEEAAVVAAAAGPLGRLGSYVAVAGPQFETPAEVEWLSRYGDVVGMSAAPEVRSARDAGAGLCLLALVANRAAAVGSHDDVLTGGAALGALLAGRLAAVITARWPGLEA